MSKNKTHQVTVKPLAPSGAGDSNGDFEVRCLDCTYSYGPVDDQLAESLKERHERLKGG